MAHRNKENLGIKILLLLLWYTSWWWKETKILLWFAVLLLGKEGLVENKDSKIQKKLFWVQLWLQRKKRKGCYHGLFKEIWVNSFRYLCFQLSWLQTLFLEKLSFSGFFAENVFQTMVTLKSYWILLRNHIFVAGTLQNHFWNHLGLLAFFFSY